MSFGQNIDILLISETKLNETFPDGQFPYPPVFLHLERIGMIKGVDLFSSLETIFPVEDLKLVLRPKIEAVLLEINFRKRKWLFIGSYCPLKNLTK